MIELKFCPICDTADIVTLLSTLCSYDESFESHHIAEVNHVLKFILKMKEVEINTNMCKRCKHIFLSPTFSPEEISLLYSEESNHEIQLSYKSAEEATGLTYRESTSGSSVTLADQYAEESILFRRKFIYDVVNSFKKSSIKSLIDIGGNNGSNILSFKESKKYVYDFNNWATPEIDFITDWEVVQSLAPFDLLISTHTLEHVVDLKNEITSYTKIIKPGSLFYVEVPMQYIQVYIKFLLYFVLKKGVPINQHINYFSDSSLFSLFSNLGFHPLYLKTHYLPYVNLRMEVIVGLFEYTEISKNSFSSNSSWYWRFFGDFLKVIRRMGYYKLFNRYPSLHNFK